MLLEDIFILVHSKFYNNVLYKLTVDYLLMWQHSNKVSIFLQTADVCVFLSGFRNSNFL